MTLHWWMHWFWVTTLLSLLLSSAVKTAPQAQEQTEEQTHIEPDAPKPLERQSRAMYFTKPPSTTSQKPPITSTETINATNPPIDQDNDEAVKPINAPDLPEEVIASEKVVPEENSTVIVLNAPELDHRSVNKTVTTTTLTPVIKTAVNITTETKNITSNDNSTASKKRNNFTKPSGVKDIENAVEGVAESRIVTEKPLSLETSFLQTRVPAGIESSRRVVDQPEGFRMDAGAIAGVSFAGLVLVALIGSTGFVLYRRRYLNKPQTLNDKCSNPDSSGYLDDSTIRDNSEEMYSLDNDSFLNSLEAMTIQNYWTDTVKHTKL